MANKPKSFIVFSEIKKRVTLEQILGHYNVLDDVRRKEDNLRLPCFICGSDDPRSFSGSMSRNAFQCFSCKTKGNIIDLVMVKEDLAIRDAALLIDKWFPKSGGLTTKKTKAKSMPKEKPPPVPKPAAGDENTPLAFCLKGLDPEHSALDQLHVHSETFAAFGAGYYSGRGMMKGCLAIPIHDDQAALVAYAGLSLEEGDYRYPKQFNRSLAVFNLHRVKDNPPAHLVVVLGERIHEVLILAERDIAAVCLMGTKISTHQHHLIEDILQGGDRITLLASQEDNIDGIVYTVASLASSLFVRVKTAAQPLTMMDTKALALLLGEGV